MSRCTWGLECVTLYDTLGSAVPICESESSNLCKTRFQAIASARVYKQAPHQPLPAFLSSTSATSHNYSTVHNMKSSSLPYVAASMLISSECTEPVDRVSILSAHTSIRAAIATVSAQPRIAQKGKCIQLNCDTVTFPERNCRPETYGVHDYLNANGISALGSGWDGPVPTSCPAVWSGVHVFNVRRSQFGGSCNIETSKCNFSFYRVGWVIHMFGCYQGNVGFDCP